MKLYRNFFLVLSFIVLLINVNTSYAKDTLQVYYLESVIVTGTRVPAPKIDIPMTISIVSERVIDEQNHIPLLDLVSQNVPNLFVTQRTNIGYGVSSGSAGTISMRGIGGSPNTQVLVLIDGRPDIMGLFGHPLGDSYFLHDVKRIEVVRGPASLMYGSNAMGGAINIITEHKHDKGLNIEVPLRIGNFNTKHGYINQTYGSDKWGYSLSFGYQDSDGFRTRGNDNYTSQSGNFETNYRFSDRLKLIINSYLSNLEVYDPGQISKPFTDHLFDIERRGGDITMQSNYNKLVSKLKLHHNFGHHDIFDGYISDDFMSGIVVTETYNYTQKSRLLIGMDLRKYGGKALLPGTDNWLEHNVNEYSFMVNIHQNLPDRIKLDGGLRYTNHSIAGDEIIPALGVSVLLPSYWTIKGYYSKGYRNPTINELYMFKPSTKELEPEISRNFEFTIEKKYMGVFSSSLSLFHTNIKNLIEKTIPIPMQPVYNNVGKLEIQGIELEGQILFPPDISINWAASASTFSKKVIGSPGEKVNLSLRYRVMEELFITLQGEWINNLNSVENPYIYTPIVYKETKAYALLNIRSNYDLNKYFSLYAQVKNITNESYEIMYGFPMPGRTFTFGITAKYK